MKKVVYSEPNYLLFDSDKCEFVYTLDKSSGGKLRIYLSINNRWFVVNDKDEVGEKNRGDIMKVFYVDKRDDLLIKYFDKYLMDA